MAQLGERRVRIAEAEGSNPFSSMESFLFCSGRREGSFFISKNGNQNGNRRFSMSIIKEILHEKREATEKHIQQLQWEGKQGVRYTAMMPDIPFLILGLFSDIGWIVGSCIL